MKKLVKNSNEVRNKMTNAIRLITEPVVQTLSPKGRNVLYQDDNGGINLTNDGVTIAKQVSSDDPIEDAVIELVKHGALKTNREAGDGTTTTTLFTSILVQEGWKKIDDGMNPMVLKKELENMAGNLVANLKPIEIKKDSDLLSVATISANGDEDIAKNVVDIVKTAGEDGIVLIEDTPKDETIIEKNTGFIIESGIFAQEYAQNNGFTARYEDCHVMITDKRLYYEEEVGTIIRTAVEAGIKDLVIVARDFIGKAVNALSHNQVNNPNINLLLVKDSKVTESNNSSLSDLAIYLGGKLISDRHGKLVDNMTADDFVLAKRVFANPQRTVLTPFIEISPELQSLVENLKKEKEKDEDNDDIGRRLASLTSGMVTVKVGGATPIEVRERMFRYEDAINATRSAVTDGYLVGGGLGVLSAFIADGTSSINGIAKKLSESSVRQIARNCGEHEDHVLDNCDPKGNIGYNAKTGEFENLLKAGIIDPYKVTEMAIKNAVSIANSILTSGWLIVQDNRKEDDK